MENYHKPFFFEKMSMYFMEKGIVILLAFILLVGFVNAQGDWGEFTDGGDIESDNSGGGDVNISSEDNVRLGSELNTRLGDIISDSEKSTEYTQDFWIALGVGAGAVLLFLFLLCLLLKRPRNKWKKK